VLKKGIFRAAVQCGVKAKERKECVEFRLHSRGHVEMNVRGLSHGPNELGAAGGATIETRKIEILLHRKKAFLGNGIRGEAKQFPEFFGELGQGRSFTKFATLPFWVL